jgi:hypothetical protein
MNQLNYETDLDITNNSTDDQRRGEEQFYENPLHNKNKRLK